MEGNGLSSRLYTNMGGEILGLQMPLHPTPPQPQNPQIHHQKNPQILPFNQQQHHEQQTQLSMKQPNYSYIANNPNTNLNTNPPQKAKIQMTQFTNSDEDEAGCSNDHESNSFDGKRKSGGGNSSSSMSPWHRMKWTDNMVRLLIMAVYYIGDEVGGSEIGSDKKKVGSGGGSGAGLLQKKGKWKSVSKAMMEKGFCVSPQQCEDKFNDLNKRYKRVNDILGKGTACKVVENRSLLESMDLSPNMKEEVRKLLNSKHLFFREMCAYHNSCNHGTGDPTSDTVSAPGQNGPTQSSLTPSQQQPHPHPQPEVQQQQQQESCLHSTQMQHSTMLHSTTNSHKVELGTEDEHDDDDNEDDDNEDESDDDEEEDEHEEGRVSKKARTMQGTSLPASQPLQHLKGQVMGMLQDSSKSLWEKKQWVVRQLVELEEEGVKVQGEALELEKQRLKWTKYSSKKEREMERMKIDNEKKRLENERLVLLLKKKELELLQHSSNHHCLSSSTFSSDN